VAYQLTIGRPLEEELRRIADGQLAAALHEIRTHPNKKRREAIGAARRHVKRVRALLRLAHPGLHGVGAATRRHLRCVNLMFGPVSDATAIAATWAEIAQRYRHLLPRHALAVLRVELERQRVVADHWAGCDPVLRTAARMLSIERKKVTDWRLTRSGFAAIAPGLEENVRAARRAMKRCQTEPDFENYHLWRSYVKTWWLQVRLLQERCGDGLAVDRERLELLDGVLGQCHDCAMLEKAVRSFTALPRQELARCLRVLHTHQAALRARAQELGRQIHVEHPRPFVRRVKSLWHAKGRSTTRASHEVTSWRAAA
jgi:hypothetical protein